MRIPKIIESKRVSEYSAEKSAALFSVYEFGDELPCFGITNNCNNLLEKELAGLLEDFIRGVFFHLNKSSGKDFLSLVKEMEDNNFISGSCSRNSYIILEAPDLEDELSNISKISSKNNKFLLTPPQLPLSSSSKREISEKDSRDKKKHNSNTIEIDSSAILNEISEKSSSEEDKKIMGLGMPISSILYSY